MLGSVRGVVSNDHSYRDKANPRESTKEHHRMGRNRLDRKSDALLSALSGQEGLAAYPILSSSKPTDSADGALSFSKARKKILLARSTVTSTWRSAELRIKLRSVSLSHFSKNVRAL